VGSLGDLHPFIAVGIALRAEGLNVVIASAPEYRDKVQAAGLGFHPMRPGFLDMERDLSLSRAQLTRAVMNSNEFLFRRLIMPYVEASYEDMMAGSSGADLLLTSSLAFGARLAAEKRGIPWLAVVLQPMMFLSAYDPPAVAHVPWLRPLLRRLGPAATRPALWALKAALGALFEPLRRLRSKVGLPQEPRNALFEGQFSALGAIALYSRVLGEPQPDYPRPTSVVGFAPFDSEDGTEARLDAALETFLAAGSAPIVFTLGSVIVNEPGDFHRESVDAARVLGRRAVLLAGERVQEFAALRSATVFVCAYAPFSLLFPRAGAIVHHGGIGTLAQALRAGRPQLIVPHFADQVDNAWRAARLGLARVLPPEHYRGRRPARDLGHLLGDPDCRALADQIASRLAAENGAALAARIVLDTLGRLRRQ